MNSKTPISALQELMAARGHPLPRYEEIGGGTNFKCTVFVEGITAVGFATSKKAAKHESAKNALEKLHYSSGSLALIKEERVVERPLKNFVGELNEYSSKNGLQYPQYDFVTCLVNGQFVYKCLFLGEEAQGRGMTKKDAKQDAAKNMLESIDRTRPVLGGKYKIIQEKTTLEIDDTDAVISMCNKLSTERRQLSPVSYSSIEPSSEIEFDEDDSIYGLEEQIKDLGIQYIVTDLQKDPYVVCFRIKKTHFTFMAAHDIREEALRKVYKNVLEVKKTGCSLSNDLLKFI